MSTVFLGVDGGGTKTAYALIDASGVVRARHVGPSVSHLASGIDQSRTLLSAGITESLRLASLAAKDVQFAFVGLPAYGEDSSAVAMLDALPSGVFTRERYRCGNDMICSWAGALACRDGISVIAGTGSMAYGEYAGRAARVGGWGEIIGDEGSAYWIAREGLNVFSRMSDGRLPRGPLYELVRRKFELATDLDLCGHVYGLNVNARSTFAQIAPLVHDAAKAGDTHAAAIFERGASELFACIVATHRALGVPDDVILPVSHTGGVLGGAALLLDAFKGALDRANRRFVYRVPEFEADIGAALYASRLAGVPLAQEAEGRLRSNA